MQTEIWKPIINEPGYEVSNLGHVRSWKGPGGANPPPVTKPKLLRRTPNNKGYLIVGLLNRRKLTTYNVHRLVADHFLPPRKSDEECSHIDGDKSNCAADNLRWETHKINMRRKVAHGTAPMREKNPRAKLKPEDIPSIKERRERGETYRSIAEDYSVSIPAVFGICSGKTWQ